MNEPDIQDTTQENIQSKTEQKPNSSTAEVRASVGNRSFTQNTNQNSPNEGGAGFAQRHHKNFPEALIKQLEARNNFRPSFNEKPPANDIETQKVQKLSGVQGGLWEPEDIIIADSIKVKFQFTSPPDTCTLMISAHGSQFVEMNINWNLKSANGKSQGVLMKSFNSEQWYEIASGNDVNDRIEAVVDEKTNGIMYRITMQVIESDVGKTNLIVQTL
jgi:hypothetical protein